MQMGSKLASLELQLIVIAWDLLCQLNYSPQAIFGLLGLFEKAMKIF
jgi:hypothetical protein